MLLQSHNTERFFSEDSQVKSPLAPSGRWFLTSFLKGLATFFAKKFEKAENFRNENCCLAFDMSGRAVFILV